MDNSLKLIANISMEIKNMTQNKLSENVKQAVDLIVAVIQRIKGTSSNW